MSASTKAGLREIAARGLRGSARLLANACIAPGLRHQLFRWSGFEIGKDSFLNMGIVAVDDYQRGMIVIGERVSIAPNVTLVADAYPNRSRLRERASLHKRGVIVIEDDAWIGAGVVILPGVRIGRGAVVGACSLVRTDVEPFAIYGGVPARKLGDVRDRT